MKKIKKIRFKFFNKILHNKFIKKIKLKNKKKIEKYKNEEIKLLFKDLIKV